MKVVVRCRPMSQQELAELRKPILDVHEDTASITIERPTSILSSGESCKRFTFDHVFGQTSTQHDVYEKTGFTIVENVLEGYNGTVFAYGQTGTGKTFTMVGPQPVQADSELRGLIPRAFSHIFDSIKSTSGSRFLLHVSYLEIYNEEIRDLLSKNPKGRLELHDRPDSGVYVKDLSNVFVDNVEQIQKVLTIGQKNRSVASTLMNQESSRSHSIFTVSVEMSTTDQSGQDHIRVGKLNLVDLAGSERQSKTGSTGDQLKEAAKINLSLSALGNVISALVDSKNSFIPYRDSKLTRLLQDSLGGNTKTVMLANVGPADYNFEETMSTLRYANRAKNITNKPKINEDPKDAVIRKYQEEIESLKRELTRSSQLGVPSTTGTDPAVTERQWGSEVEYNHEEERRKIFEWKSTAEEEKHALLKELEQKRTLEADHLKQKELLADRLKSMETKLLRGSEVIELAAQQERELQKAKRDLEDKCIEEARMKKLVEEQAEERGLLAEKFESQAEHVANLSDKLQLVWQKYRSSLQDIEEANAEFSKDRADFLETIRSLRKESSLQQKIIEVFIPSKEENVIKSRCIYDESSQTWLLPLNSLQSTEKSDEPRSIRDVVTSKVSSITSDRSNVSDFYLSERPTGMGTMMSVHGEKLINDSIESFCGKSRYFNVSPDGSLVREQLIDHKVTLTASRRGRTVRSDESEGKLS